MADSLFTDDLLRQLVAVGHVDILVGVPTLNNATTIVELARAAQVGLTQYFPRARTLLFNSDGGSDDGTPSLLRYGSPDETGTVTASHTMRTTHRITTPYHGLPGKGSALRVIFAVADLLSADVVVILDPDVTTLTPDWIAALATPVRDGRVEFVAPLYPRAVTDVPLVTQLVRPLMRAAYGWRLREPLVGEFACAGRFAAACLERPIWDERLTRDGIDVWIAGEALAGGFRAGQATLGPRVLSAGRERPGLLDAFQQLIGATFAALDQHAGYWVPRIGSEPLPGFGGPPGCAERGAVPDLVQMAQNFARDVDNLRPVLASILSPETLAAVQAAALGTPRVRYPDDLWAATVFEFLLAHHTAVMTREHVTQALLPLYLGRTASFLFDHADSGPAVVEDALEALCVAFEQAKPAAAARWTPA